MFDPQSGAALRGLRGYCILISCLQASFIRPLYIWNETYISRSIYIGLLCMSLFHLYVGLFGHSAFTLASCLSCITALVDVSFSVVCLLYVSFDLFMSLLTCFSTHLSLARQLHHCTGCRRGGCSDGVWHRHLACACAWQPLGWWLCCRRCSSSCCRPAGCVCVCARKSVCARMYMYLYVYIYICIHACIDIYMYI